MDTRIEYRQVTYRVLFDRPSDAQYLSATAGAARFVWNRLLGKQRERYQLARTLGIQPPAPSFFNLCKDLTRLRRETTWRRDYPSKPVRHALKYQALAWRAFFRNPTGDVGPPRFKSRWRGDSLTLPEDVKIIDGRLRFPKRGCLLTLRRRGGDPYPIGKPVQAVFRRVNGKWHCTVCVAIAAPERVDDGSVIGVDMNAGQVAVHDGTAGRILQRPDDGKLVAKAKRLDRKMRRQRKGSRRRDGTRARLANIHRRMATRRHNWQHHVSRELRTGMVIVEDLRPKAMTRSARGTVEKPGRNVKAKSGLNRLINGTGWGTARRMFDYKAPAMIAVYPANTSRECAVCGHVAAASRPSQARFQCVACGHTDHAALNAARTYGVGDWRSCTARGVRICRPLRPVQRIGGWQPKLSTHRYKPPSECNACLNDLRPTHDPERNSCLEAAEPVRIGYAVPHPGYVASAQGRHP